MTQPVATIIAEDPIVIPMGQMQLIPEGIMEMAKWIQRYRPQCVPEQGFENILDLLPHDGSDVDPFTGLARPRVTDNELLAEFAGRKCYDSFADAGAKRSNNEYLKSMWQGRIPHRSTGYHPKMSFFIAHVSRRVSHELIRNYVGSDRDEEGSPSQESTRFTHHPGMFIAHPYYLDNAHEMTMFEGLANANYTAYVNTIQRKVNTYELRHGKKPVGLDKKRIFESTSGDLLMSCGTSFIWTTNPMALTKFFHERDDEAADMEMCRFAKKWKQVCFARWPNLFTDFQPKAP
jgi:thymidylate synthase ThyX